MKLLILTASIILFSLLSFYINTNLGLFILGIVIGTVIGFYVSLYLGWIYRKLLNKRTESELYFYDITYDEIVTTKKGREDNQFVKFLIRDNKLTNTITFIFTDYYDGKAKNNVKLVGYKRFVFEYFEENSKDKKDWINLYKSGNIKSFIDNIFWVARNNEYKPHKINLSNNLLDVKEILNIKE
jgi:hypothetical protein